MTQETSSSADDRRLEFPPRAWVFSEILKHFTDKLAVMPFFLFDGPDAISLFRISNGLPVALVSVRGRELTGVSELKDSDQESAAGLNIHFDRGLTLRQNGFSTSDNVFTSSFIIANNIQFASGSLRSSHRQIR
jgi:hypothetical protein